MCILRQFFWSLVFLLANVFILLWILAMNRGGWFKAKGQDTSAQAQPDSTPDAENTASQEKSAPRVLKASDILDWEFEYARTTASEAMRDRHTMMNFYLLVVGVVASGVVALLGKDSALPKAGGTVLLWVLCLVGWLYFLKLIRLRQAWHDSARAMNQIKEFYIQHAEKLAPEVLRSAFRWKPDTLPPPDKPWTVFFYSATLIALLNTVAYVAGGALLCLSATLRHFWAVATVLGTLGLVFFAFHICLYFAFLKPPQPKKSPASTPSEDK